MAFSRKKNLFFSFIFLIAWVSTLAFWYEANTRFTEFSYDSTGDIKTLNLTVSGSEQWSFFVYLANKSQETISGRFSFVDAIALEGGAVACLSENEKSNVWQYLSAVDTGFTLTWWETLVKEITYKFPSNWSWSYYGCVTYIPDGIEDSNANPIPRKALILNVILNPEEVEVSLIANLWSRGNARTSNNNGYQSKWKIFFYNRSDWQHPVYSWYAQLDSDWMWPLNFKVLAGCYDVVYKWFHHLSSYMTDVCIVESWSSLNFVSGSNLSWVGMFNVDLPYNGWLWFQVAWDMPRADNKYDFVVNATDLSVLYWSRCPYMSSVSKWHVCDLNNDGEVDSSDASAILENLFKEDLCFCADDDPECVALFGWFGTINYFD